VAEAKGGETVSTFDEAVRRFHRLDAVRSFPRKCDMCERQFFKSDDISVRESAVHPLVMHTECAQRRRRSVRP